MKFFAVIALIACLIAVAQASGCSLYCSYAKADRKPICASRNILGKYEYHNFDNKCFMREENECHGGNWQEIPCTQKKDC